MNPQSLKDVMGREINYKKILKAPRELVFNVWTTPEHLAAWWGPDGFTLTTISADFSEGGTWKFIMHGPDGRDYANKIVFTEVIAPERISYHHADDGEAEPVSFRVTVTFRDIGISTEVEMNMVFESREELERVEKEYQAIAGGNQNIARMAAYVEQLALA